MKSLSQRPSLAVLATIAALSWFWLSFHNSPTPPTHPTTDPAPAVSPTDETPRTTPPAFVNAQASHLTPSPSPASTLRSEDSAVTAPTNPIAAFNVWAARFHSGSSAVPNPNAPSDADVWALAQRRRDEMEELIRSNPKLALESALPDSVRAGLPANLTPFLEERISARGDLEVLCALPEPGRESEVTPLTRSVVVGDRRFKAFVYGTRLSQPTRRDTPIQGIALGNIMAVDERPVRDLDPSVVRALLAAQPEALCSEGLDHPAANPLARALEAYGTAALFCCPAHATRFEARLAAAGTGSEVGATAAPLAASSATEGLKRLLYIRVDFSDLTGEPFTTNRAAELTREVHRFFQENSYGRAGFFEIGNGSAVTPVFRMPRTAASYGSNDDAGDLRTDARNAARNAGFVLSDYDYDITCMRSVPGFGWAGLGFVGAPGAWIRGTSSTGVTAHELGHNYGLAHANFWDTGGTSVTGAGDSIEYGDKFDTMGAASAGNNHFNARYKRLLGWLKAGEFTVATTNGVYRLFAHDQTNSVAGSRGLQVFSNASTNYWVEFRQRFSGNRWLFNGVSLRWAGRGNEASLLLDTTPGTPREKDDSAVTLGRTYSDTAAGIHLTPIAKGGSAPAWIDVMVQRGAFQGNRPPVLSLTSPRLDGNTTTALEFQATASDPDGDSIAYHWEFGDETLGTNSPSITHRWSSAGDYRVQCVASDMKGGTARASVTVRIGSPSGFRLSGRVTADGEPVNGARIATSPERFTHTDSDGTFTLTGVPAGTYTLSAILAPLAIEPVNFSNPLSVSQNRTGLDLAAVDIAQRRPVTLLAAGSSWRYLDSGSFPGAAWIEPDFDDSAWNVGPAILGYGGDRETTVVSFGSDSSRKHITTWFRRTFVINDPSRLTQIQVGLLRDDGAAVYLNGRELFRDNLPNGTITAQTLASGTAGGTEELTYFERSVDANRLLAGTNHFAVEVHQASQTSSDIAFDLRLTAEAIQATEDGIRIVRPAPDESFTTPGRLVISAAVGTLASRPVQRVVFQADGHVIGAATNAPYTITWFNPPAGSHSLVARAILPDTSAVDSTAVPVVVVDSNRTPTVIPRGAVWRYLDTGIAPDASWNGVTFDDATWPQGPARLGYGEDGEFTVIEFGPNAALKHVTSWFRHAFNVVDPASVTNLICRLARDDGAVVYLNGVELFRSGIRAGAVTPSLLAQSDVRDAAEITFSERSVSPVALVEGRNVVAVELHQASRSSSDVGFDLELVAQRSSVPEAPELRIRIVDRNLRISWPSPYAHWVLEQTQTPSSTSSWVPVETSPPTPGDGARVNVSLPTSGDAVFYRLSKPR